MLCSGLLLSGVVLLLLWFSCNKIWILRCTFSAQLLLQWNVIIIHLLIFFIDIFKDTIGLKQLFKTCVSTEDSNPHFCVIAIIRIIRSHCKLTLFLQSVHLFAADCPSIIHVLLHVQLIRLRFWGVISILVGFWNLYSRTFLVTIWICFYLLLLIIQQFYSSCTPVCQWLHPLKAKQSPDLVIVV